MGLETKDSAGDAGAPIFATPADMRGSKPGAPLSPDILNRRLVHDLRAPLRAMRFLPEWVREDAIGADMTLPESVLDHLILIERQAQRMDGFLTGLQDLCRLEDPERAPARTDLSEALAQAIAETPVPDGFDLQSVPVLPSDGLSANVRPDSSRPGETLAVQARPGHLELMLRHLIGNAIHHHDRHDGRVWIGFRRNGSSGVIEVADDGPGIAAADQSRVFEPFTTLRPRDEVEGAGLGLTIAARVAALQRGRIEIFSRGRGTLVRVRLPLESTPICG